MATLALLLALIISFSIQTLVGFLNNVFIMVVNLRDWWKTRRLTSADIILVTIGASNILLQCATALDTYLWLIWCEIMLLKNVYKIIFVLEMGTIICSFWLTTWLCVFYCLKIANINHPIFVWLKHRVRRMVPWVLAACVVLPVVFSTPTYWNVRLIATHNETENLASCRNGDVDVVVWDLSTSLFTGILGCCLPLVLVILSVTLIVFSLCRHTWRMKRNMAHCGTPNLNAHVRVAGSVMGLLILYTSFGVAEFLVFHLQLEKTGFWYITGWAIIVSFCPAQSGLLILSNTN